ncbi:carboxymuconolactone decarboxylase family protein [Achromobacter spanius]|uniref:4-carboxymuconolactone decarboxylase n=1 Tax=Achromobacter spanius TaxID=217203 RepID=A0A2S0IAH0_9BURK|nr:carboxymuconolactone decarboxylase family protein [Achromobacter spanius]AVJ29041.1 4-carboxymuconolactone decarboxylase [Achromobacter spanius]
MARVGPPLAAEMSAEQKRIHDLIASGPRGRVRGPLAVWLHRPAMAEPAQGLGQFCRYDSSLPPRLSELAILVLAREWKSEFEWWAHKAIALKAGVSQAVVDALRDRREIAFEHADEALIHEFLVTLHETRRIPDALYQRAERMFGRDGVIDLVALAGYYTLISMTLNVFEIDPPDGEPLELKAADDASAARMS